MGWGAAIGHSDVLGTKAKPLLPGFLAIPMQGLREGGDGEVLEGVWAPEWKGLSPLPWHPGDKSVEIVSIHIPAACQVKLPPPPTPHPPPHKAMAFLKRGSL